MSGLASQAKRSAAAPGSSLVDATEEALREHLAPGKSRPGDRVAPELELAKLLGVSRGTLRLALERLEANGEIVRRQGSGTFVGRVAAPAAFSEGLEVLESYTSLARRQGKRLAARAVEIEEVQAPGYVAEALGIPLRSNVLSIRRTLSADRAPAAYMHDYVPRDLGLSDTAAIKSALRRGKMVLDLLIAQGLAVAFARTQIRPRLVEPRDPIGEALGVNRVTAMLEVTELMHLAEGRAVQYSIDVFVPGSVDLHVIRGIGPSSG